MSSRRRELGHLRRPQATIFPLYHVFSSLLLLLLFICLFFASSPAMLPQPAYMPFPVFYRLSWTRLPLCDGPPDPFFKLTIVDHGDFPLGLLSPAAPGSRCSWLSRFEGGIQHTPLGVRVISVCPGQTPLVSPSAGACWFLSWVIWPIVHRGYRGSLEPPCALRLEPFILSLSSVSATSNPCPSHLCVYCYGPYNICILV
jgi:hypothetical protein